MLMKKIETGKEVPRIASCWKEWLDAARITAWLEKQVNHYHEYMTREVNGYSRVISDAVEYICRSFRNPDLSLNDVAAYVHLSPGYLSGEFKRETGVTLKSYLTDIRIEAAKKMMEDGNYKIYEICSAVGYNSSQYFSRAFYKKPVCSQRNIPKKGEEKTKNKCKTSFRKRLMVSILTGGLISFYHSHRNFLWLFSFLYLRKMKCRYLRIPLLLCCST